MKLVFRAMISIKLPIKKEDAMKITCRYCAKKKEVPAYEVKRGNGKFCSRSCASKYNYYQKNKHIIGGKKGKDNPNWKGGKTLCTKGYRMIYKPDHPYAHNGYIMEHRAVLEDVLGRYITPTEKSTIGTETGLIIHRKTYFYSLTIDYIVNTTKKRKKFLL